MRGRRAAEVGIAASFATAYLVSINRKADSSSFPIVVVQRSGMRNRTAAVPAVSSREAGTSSFCSSLPSVV